MSNYITTNIRLPEEDYFRLKQEAARQRKSLSAVIREKVSESKQLSQKQSLHKLLQIKGDWFSIEEFEKNRQEIDEKLKKDLYE